jgi:hypothetical protein
MKNHMTQQRRLKRLFAIAGAACVAAAGTLGLAVSADSDDTDAVAAKTPATAPATALPADAAHYPTPLAADAYVGPTSSEPGPR